MTISLSAPLSYAYNNEKVDPKHEFRSLFERDRDRILHSTNFRRLEGKTQIFLSTSHDHVRNRLTHTLEVSQIARTITRQLNLDEILTEAISLGHDLGHTPFGHVGERTLHEIMNGCEDIYPRTMEIPEKIRGFKHNLQSVRVVSTLLRPYKDFEGLDLTNYTLWGILFHTSLVHKDDSRCMQINAANECCDDRNRNKCASNGNKLLCFYDEYMHLANIRQSIDTTPAWSFEGLVVAIADEIAQRHHDIEDGLISKIISIKELYEFLLNQGSSPRSN